MASPLFPDTWRFGPVTAFRQYLLMKKTILGISLFHGHMRALPVIKGMAKEPWDCPDLVKTPDELRAALKDAIRATAFSGSRVSFLVEDSRFVHLYLQVPPMQQADLDQYLARRVDQEKPFDGPAAWRFRRALKARELDGILLDIWPQQYVDELMAVCHDVNLLPVLVVPLSAVFVDQVWSLPVEPDDILLLVTVRPGEAALMVAKGDGMLFFDRFLSLGVDLAHEAERISREITRSIKFAEQQFSTMIRHVWITGDAEQVSAERLAPYVDRPVLQSPIVPDPSYWIGVSLKLPATHPCNFTPVKVRMQPVWKMARNVALGLVAGLVVAWVSAVSLVEAQLFREQSVMREMAPRVASLTDEKRQWQLRLAQIESQQAWAKSISQDRDPPLVGWFLSALGAMLPGELVLTSVSFAREDGGWMLELEGTAPVDMTTSATELERFEHGLVDGPYHVHIRKSWREAWLEQLQRGGSDRPSDQRSRFVIAGWIGTPAIGP